MTAALTWDIQPGFWADFVSRCPNATYFHTPGWYQAHAESMGYKCVTPHIRFDDGTEALLPMATRRKFKGVVVEAMAGIETGYGGLISPLPLTQAQVDEVYRLVITRYPDFVVTSNPHESYNNIPSWLQATEDYSQVVPLLPPDEQRKMMSKSRLKTVRRGDEEDYDLTIIEKLTVQHVAEFYPCYADHAAEWNYTKYVRDRAYFEALVRHSGENLVLFLAYHEGNLCGFRLLGRQGRTVMALNVARVKAYENWNVGPYLAAQSMAWCHAQGLEVMDLMPSGQLESVRAYKASFGGQALPYLVGGQMGVVGRSVEQVWRAMRGVRPLQQVAAS